MSKLPTMMAEDDVMERLAKAHEAMHNEIAAHERAQEVALGEVWLRHAPFIKESQSVFLQVEAEAYRAGFTDNDIQKALSSHGEEVHPG